jgi:hypothetical protein
VSSPIDLDLNSILFGRLVTSAQTLAEGIWKDKED